eukprot:m.234753 g.234753  ORF g.234753 m.234753 type:complete len:1739 (-) comp17391_c0_seq2:66-5282(-)
MVQSAGKQLKLLLWKNFTLSRRRPCFTVFEIILPVLFILMLVAIRQQSEADAKNACVGGCHYEQANTFFADLAAAECNSTNFTLGYTQYPGSEMELGSKIYDALGNLIATLDSNLTKYNIKFDMQLVNYSTEQAMLDAFDSPTNGACKAGIVMNASASQMDFAIRFDSTPGGYSPENDQQVTSWLTEATFPFFPPLGPRDDSSIILPDFGSNPGYLDYGYLAIQTLLSGAIAEAMVDNPADLLQLQELLANVRVNRMPYPEYSNDGFIYAIQFGLPLFLMLALLFTSVTIVRNVVHEKERRLKESMRMMGLRNWAHWTAWFIQAFSFLLLSMTLCAILMKVGNVLENSDVTLVWFFLFSFAMATVALCFFISSLFTKAATGAAAGGVLWFGTYVPYMFVSPRYQTLSYAAKTGYCMISTTGMALGANLLSQFEARGDGVQWSTVSKPVSVDDSFTFGTVIFMFWVDTALYLLLTWYMENAFPGEYGIPKPWYFPLQPSYWTMSHSQESQPLLSENVVHENSRNFEVDPEGLEAGVDIRNLRKVFGTKVAVNGTSLKMFEGQITALLGHNGAGKTTTMSCLTGLYPPTAGTAVVNGFDLRSNIDGVRNSLGICPQHDVLFDTLTVEEHLRFFCKLKGVPDLAIQGHVDEMIDALQLPDKRHAPSKTLSGGMKRKLSCAIAIIGGSKVVILDEPTSGMDPAARRATWDLLTRFKEGRTMLLSTHFLDEADLLGDRIAIMSSGHVVCAGSSMFLKHRYGRGYHMTVVKSDGCQIEQVQTLIERHVPDVELEGNLGAESTFILPRDSSSVFPALFEELDTKQQELGVMSYGLSITTMEEVFLKVGEHGDDDTKIDIQSRIEARRKDHGVNHDTTGFEMEEGHALLGDSSTDGSSLLASSSNLGKLNRGLTLKLQQLKALIVKRALHSLRNKWAILTQLALPMIFVFVALLVAKTYPGPTDSPARKMYDIKAIYGDNRVFVTDRAAWDANSTAESRGFATRMADLFKREEAETVVEVYGSGKHHEHWGNFSDYLLDQVNGKPRELAQFNKNSMFGFSFEPSDILLKPVVWFNGNGYHTIAEGLLLMQQALLRNFTDSDNFALTMTNSPLPRNDLERAQDQSDNMMGFYVSFTIVFGMAFLASSFVLFLVTERSNKAKHIQFVSGVDIISYWLSSYIWDVINFLLPTFGCMILFLAFNVTEYADERLGYVCALFLLYGLAVIPSMYMFSFLFSQPAFAYAFMVIINIVTGLAAMLTISILGTINQTTADQLKNAFLFLPNYCFGQGLSDLYTNYQNIQVVKSTLPVCAFFLNTSVEDVTIQQCCSLKKSVTLGDAPYQIACETDYWSMDSPGIGRYAICMFFQAIVFFGLILAIEARVFSFAYKSAKPNEQPKKHQDPDLDAEEQSVKGKVTEIQHGNNDDVLVINDLSKVYTRKKERKVAVDRMFLSVPKGGCFGLLGVNGAGKTTTFKMLTGDELPTAGQAYIKGHDIQKNPSEARRLMGYTPQFDGLIELMTGRELLTMYARLRGVQERRIARVVQDLIESLMLEKYADKQCGTYSGGNKRKLSTAVALCGPSPVILLDEPTTGMDPGARRFLWDALLEAMRGGRSIVLTSHSMDECEALCTRLAIMVNGQFRALGSLQHLKSKYGQGITLETKMDADRVQDFHAFIQQAFPKNVLKDKHQGLVKYELMGVNSWAFVFGKLEEAKEQFGLEDYSVSQTTLEQVFLDLIKEQKADELQSAVH